MAIQLNDGQQVWGNIVAIIVVFFVFLWLYKNMEENRFKGWLREQFESIKEVFKNG
jgi:hypothetical protein